jgi:serine/threonine protein kinase
MINQLVANYTIVSVLGEGGMGTVYLAEHKLLNKKAAIKSLHSNLISNQNIRTRFRNEAQTLLSLKNPNIVELYDYVENEKGCYMIMEYIDGVPLDTYINTESGPIEEKTALIIINGILNGFRYAHNKGIVHRDVKPANIIISRDFSQVKILDFGIAKILGESNKNLTKDGTHMGTVYYMSPEQVKGNTLDQRSDIYSIGITIFQIVTGVNPYQNYKSEFEIFKKITEVDLADAKTIYRFVPEYMNQIIKKATQKNVLNRYQNCDEIINDLNKQNNEEKITGGNKFQKLLIPLSILAVLMIGLISYYLYTDSNQTSKSSVILNPKPEEIESKTLKIQANSLIDLSAQIKAKSENMLSNKYFHPEEIKLDLNQFTFQCTFIKKNTPHHIKKLGLYYGPKSTGCQSCEMVLFRNPGSTILAEKENSIFVSQIIGISD